MEDIINLMKLNRELMKLNSKHARSDLHELIQKYMKEIIEAPKFHLEDEKIKDTVNNLLVKYNIDYTVIKEKDTLEHYYVDYKIKNYNEEDFKLIRDEFKKINGFIGWEYSIMDHIITSFIKYNNICYKFSFYIE